MTSMLPIFIFLAVCGSVYADSAESTVDYATTTLSPYEEAKMLFKDIESWSSMMDYFVYTGGELSHSHKDRIMWIREMLIRNATQLMKLKEFLSQTYGQGMREIETESKGHLSQAEEKEIITRLLGIDEAIVLTLWHEQVNLTRAGLEKSLMHEVKTFAKYHTLEEVLQARIRFDSLHGTLISNSRFTRPYKAYCSFLKEKNIKTYLTKEYGHTGLSSMEYSYRGLLAEKLTGLIVANQTVTELEKEEVNRLTLSLETKDMEEIKYSIARREFPGAHPPTLVN